MLILARTLKGKIFTNRKMCDADLIYSGFLLLCIIANVCTGI